MTAKQMNWNDRFAVIDHFNPTDAQICATFGITNDELSTARSMRDGGTFTANAQLDVAKYDGLFVASQSDGDGVAAPAASAAKVKPAAKKGGATVHAKPETATKKAKVPQKRGRKGDKIHRALQAVTSTPVAVDSFIKQYGVSLAVLRQSKRFLDKMDPVTAKKIGKINVRQDKTSKQLMIWREDA